MWFGTCFAFLGRTHKSEHSAIRRPARLAIFAATGELQGRRLSIAGDQPNGALVIVALALRQDADIGYILPIRRELRLFDVLQAI